MDGDGLETPCALKLSVSEAPYDNALKPNCHPFLDASRGCLLEIRRKSPLVVTRLTQPTSVALHRALFTTAVAIEASTPFAWLLGTHESLAIFRLSVVGGFAWTAISGGQVEWRRRRNHASGSVADDYYAGDYSYHR